MKSCTPIDGHQIPEWINLKIVKILFEWNRFSNISLQVKVLNVQLVNYYFAL